MEINYKILLLCCSFSLSSPLIAQDNYFYQNNKKITLNPIPQLVRSNSLLTEQEITYYTTEQGHKVGVYNKIIVKFKESDDLDPFLLLSPYDVAIDKQLGVRLYLLMTPSHNAVIDIANRLTEQDFIEYAHPDFIKKYQTR